MIKLREYKEKTDIIIFGIHSDMCIELQDDYIDYNIGNYEIETDGFLTICSEEEFRNMDMDIDISDLPEEYQNGILIKDYVGEFHLQVDADNQIDYFNETNYDPNTFINYQVGYINKITLLYNTDYSIEYLNLHEYLTN